MIKRTFYNLPKEKREKIIDVTKKEFSKGNKKKITINSVIEKAGISRGSFYQYFDDKLDLVELITDDMINKLVSFVQNELMINGGDIFMVPLKIFDIMISNKNNTDKIVALDPQSNPNSNLISDYMQYRYRNENPFGRIIEYIDTGNFVNKSNEDVQCVVCLLFDQIKNSIFNVSKNITSPEEERNNLLKKVSIIKRGALN